MLANGNINTVENLEFSHLLALENIYKQPQKYKLEANPGECALIAKRLDLIHLDALHAELSVKRKTEKLIQVEGRVEAKYTQRCVRSLEEVSQVLEEKVREVFSLTSTDFQQEVDVSLEEEAEPLIGQSLNLGEIIVQVLSLNIKPFPTKRDSSFLDYIEDADKESPFQELLKSKRNQKASQK